MLTEDTQHAVVAIKNGFENLLLQVQLGREALPEKAEKLVWITPVPAQASDVQIDVLRGFPTFNGFHLERWMGSRLRDILAGVSLTQIYTAPMLLLFATGKSASGDGGVTVFKRIVKDGIEVQLLGAKQAEGETTLGVQIRFPSKTGFFPLIATSAIPNESIEIIVTTVEGIAAIHTWRHAEWLALLFALLVLIGFSLLAGSLARFAFPLDCRPSGWTAAKLGLFNVATLIGLIIASVITARRIGAPASRGLRFALMTSLFFCLLLASLAAMTLLIG